jgi:N-methylhydantoinase A
MGYFCGIDIGGTFTDCVVLDDAGTITLAKVSSTPPHFAEGFLNAIDTVAGRLGLETEDFLGQTDLLLHGTTVGTNALVQMKGARTGLITTRGHGDALIIMRSAGRSAGLTIDELLHVSRHKKPEPIVPRTRIKEVSERMDWAGDVLLELNEAEVRSAIEELVADGVEAIAVSFLWGFVNTDHELRVKALIEELAPGVLVSCAHELIAKPGEYERTAAAAINAFIGPATSSYIQQVDRVTTERGYTNPLLIMQASGGVVHAEQAARHPLFTIASGPVGGVAGAAYLAQRMGHPNVIACDMGGTSFDVGIIVDGGPVTSSETVINQYTFFMPRVDIESIGSGGGSLLWIDEHSGTMRVGPQSAGALPGPVCYGRGGTEPTVTDCDAVLGRYNPDNFLGGELELDRAGAEAAVERVSSQIGLEPVAAADGALRIVESQMADLMRQMTVERGRDPRDFVIYAFGGAGAAHAVAFARELGAAQVVIPLGDLASTWSALGVMTSDVLHIREHSEVMIAPFSPDRMNEIYAAMESSAREQLHAEGFEDDDIELTRLAEMKFSLQIHQVEVPVPGGALTAKDAEEQVGRFHDRYEEIYGKGSAFTGAGTSIGLFKLMARGRVRTPMPPPIERSDTAPVGRRDVYWRDHGSFTPTDIYDGAKLSSEVTIDGPAILEFPDTTVVVPPGASARMDELGSVLIDVGADGVAPSSASTRATASV